MSRLGKYYKENVLSQFMATFGYGNVSRVPAISKITINMGVGEAVSNKASLDAAVLELQAITGQKPVITKARKANSGFKIRAGLPIGCKVTLRGDRMYDFIEKMVSVALPRVRDFRGLNPGSFDGMGNYSFGISQQFVFPEIDFDKIDAERGMDICISTTAHCDKEAYELLRLFRFPFKKS